LAQDFYELLGVSRDASDVEIKKAYRKLAQQHHPDKHSGSKEIEEKFKLINEAYDALKDPGRRAQYDRFGSVSGPAGGGGGGYQDSGYGSDFQDLFSEVFSDFFGGGGGRGGPRRPAPERGADLHYELEIDFEEAAFGCEKQINVQRTVNCETCRGSGAKAGTQPETCTTCGGRGQVAFQQGFLQIARTCNACHGRGAVIKEACADCRGHGKVRRTRDMGVKIPAGVDTGSRLRLMTEGDFGTRGGPPGDLYVSIFVKEHSIFSREENDVICEVPISFTAAALGTELEVPTLEGPVKLKVPAGTQSGKIFRLKHKGIASVRSGRRGDEQVVITVETPTKLTKEQRELLLQFAEVSGEESTPLHRNFFSKVKDLFK